MSRNLKDKYALEKQISELQQELERLNKEMRLEEEIQIEICDECNHYYAGRSEMFLIFGKTDYETRDIDNPYTHCHGCGKLIKRHDSFMKALEYIKSDESVNIILLNHREYLSDKALIGLVQMLMHITVPSFCGSFSKEHNAHDVLKELQEKDYIRVIEDNIPSHIIILFNVRKLKLYEQEDILNTINIQKYFDTPYLYNKDVRSIRLGKLTNDFTLADKKILLERFNNRCAFTGKEVELHLDHVIPVAWEIEGTTLSNMLPLWDRLNSSKHDNNVFKWYKNKGKEYEVEEELFIEAMTYIANLNNMSIEEYERYVYDCEGLK